MAMHTRHLARRDNPLLAIKLPPFRSHLVMLLMALAFVALAARAAYLQVMSHTYLQKQGGKRYERTLDLPASRGRIVDRHGQVLAASVPARAIWAIPDQVETTPDSLRALAKMLQTTERELAAMLDSDDRFLYLKRQVDEDVAARIMALNIPGIYQRAEFKRHYPEGASLAHLVGFTNVEDVGLQGVELGQQKQLAGKPGMRRVIKDGRGRIVDDIQAVLEPRDGRDITLSIDTKMQYLVHEALRATVREHRAQAGAAVVLDIHTGEILALSNWPTFNPNDRAQLKGEQTRNWVINETFEPGSTMKPFTVALALELGKVKPSTMIQTAPGKLTIGTATIGDAHPHGPLTVEQVLQKSSNVGTAKLALAMQAREMWDLYVALGLGQAPEIAFPGAKAGRVHPYKKWKPIEQATMSYGHGLSVSLLQLARAYTVFGRDGELTPLTLLKPDRVPSGAVLMKPETARAVLKMLEMSAGPEGTAPRAQVQGYRVAGKTGTSIKVEDGRYVKKYVASFVGLAPVSNPRVVVAVMIDEPSNGKYYAGEVAAPLFSKITGDVLRSMHVPPDNPIANLVMPLKAVEESL